MKMLKKALSGILALAVAVTSMSETVMAVRSYADTVQDTPETTDSVAESKSYDTVQKVAGAQIEWTLEEEEEIS